ncbi:MAG: hypothetical protein OXC63_15585 [Aestuariivita sp.]|nr:hypothetical protein [Aestuariivita sp.]
MKMQRSLRGMFAAVLCAGVSLVSPASAGNVTVTEGETATFQITVTRKSGTAEFDESGRVRLWYDTHGGTAVEGTDYQTAHSWAHFVQAWSGSPVTISVPTFEDAAVEGDETFNIRIRKIEVWVPKRWFASYWRLTPKSKWKISGVKSATIIDATPQEPESDEHESDEHESYEDEKYGPGYTGQTFGE